MLTVACVLRTGGCYDASWVARLRAGVAKHLPIKYRFVCLSDVDVPCERIQLDHDWPGWWSKLETFRLPGPVLYFDLDTAIVGNLTDVANQARDGAGFTILRDFYRQDGLGSGMMAWDAGCSVGALYETFAADPRKWMDTCGGRGDQNFIERQGWTVNLWQDVCAGKVVSFKVHCAPQLRVPDGASVVCFHGQPKTLDLAWLYEHLPNPARSDVLHSMRPSM